MALSKKVHNPPRVSVYDNEPNKSVNLSLRIASVSVRFWSKERGTRVKDRAKDGVSERARPKPRIPFLGLSLLRNQTETLATQAR